MTDISKLFYRNSYFTKVHEESNVSDKNKNQINSKDNNNNSDNNSHKSNSSYSSNNSNKIEDKELELYFAEVETIIPIDEKINNNAVYNIRIKSSINPHDSWVRSYTLDEITNFRYYLLKYTYNVINLPFPTKSLLRFLPYLGNKYDERNWDILLENKFLLDDFFKTICIDKEMYKLSGFINFFSKPITKRNSNSILYQ